MKDILYNDLVALIEYMYQGEVRVKHNGLPSFLRTAEVLQVRGLTEQAAKQNISQLNSDALLDKIPNLNPCPSFIDEPLSVHVQVSIEAFHTTVMDVVNEKAVSLITDRRTQCSSE